MKKNEIGSFELCSILYSILRTGSIGASISIMINFLKQDAWIPAIIGIILGFFLLLIYHKLWDIKEENNILDNFNNIFGNKIGFIINILNIIICISLASITFWSFNDFIISQFLSETPAYFISIFFLIPIIYILLNGLSVIGRTNLLLFYINIFSLFLIELCLVFNVNFENFEPFFMIDTISIIRGVIAYITFNVSPIFLLLIIPKKDIIKKENFKKQSIIMYLIVQLTLFLGIFFTIGILGVDLSIIYSYPEYHNLETINIFGYIRKFENVLSIAWVFSFFMLIVMSLYYSFTSIKQIFKIKNNKIKNIIIVALSVLSSIIANNIFTSSTYATNFLKDIYVYIIFIFFIIIPSISLLIYKIKN